MDFFSEIVLINAERLSEIKPDNVKQWCNYAKLRNEAKIPKRR